MPLYKEERIGQNAKLLIWHITEEFNDLFDEVALTDKNMVRMMSMKSEQHQRGFLSVRKLLQHAGYTDFDMYYTETGKPRLKDNRHISISHSHDYSTILLSDTVTGLDLEVMRDKVIRIAHKYTSDEEENWLVASAPDYTEKLTAIWGAKESIFKIRNEIGISFKDHISVAGLDKATGRGIARLDFESEIHDFAIRYQTFDPYVLVYAYPIEDAGNL